MILLKTLFNRKWWLVTLVVIAGMVLLAWLGTWQLDRREQKRAANAALAQRWLSEPFNINNTALPTDLVELEYRQIQATGKFDFDHQIAVKNAMRNEVPGVNLVTPLVFADGRAVLVARGWIPYDQAKPEQWSQFDEAAESEVAVIGLLKESYRIPEGVTPPTNEKEWYYVNIDALQPQIPYPLLPAFVEMLAEPGRSFEQLPVRAAEPAPLDDFMHLNYAVQWFLFSIILGFMYIQLVVQQERRAKRLLAEQGQVGVIPSPPGMNSGLTATSRLSD